MKLGEIQQASSACLVGNNTVFVVYCTIETLGNNSNMFWLSTHYNYYLWRSFWYWISCEGDLRHSHQVIINRGWGKVRQMDES